MNTARTLSPVDPLGEVLQSLRMRGAFYCRSELTAPWGLDLPAMEGFLMLHFVASGTCWLEMPGEAPSPLRAGELALLSHGRGHAIVSHVGAAKASLFELPRVSVGERYEIIHHGAGGEATSLICGAARFDDPAANHLLSLLPPLIRVSSATTSLHDWLPSALRLMAEEARELRPGAETVVTRLADILVVQAIRSWVSAAPLNQTGWIAGLKDRHIGHALAAIHRDPARPWSVGALAAEVAMSRSAFAARFNQLVGMPPMHYVTEWRMRVAHTWLKDDPPPLARVAARVGYQSEAAFGRAFKRFAGISPGAVPRRNERQPSTLEP